MTRATATHARLCKTEINTWLRPGEGTGHSPIGLACPRSGRSEPEGEARGQGSQRSEAQMQHGQGKRRKRRKRRRRRRRRRRQRGQGFGQESLGGGRPKLPGSAPRGALFGALREVQDPVLELGTEASEETVIFERAEKEPANLVRNLRHWDTHQERTRHMRFYLRLQQIQYV